MDIKLSSTDGEKMAKFFAAFSKAQSAINNVLADTAAHKHKYAELHQVLAAIRKPFADNGLAIIQTPSSKVTVKDDMPIVKDYLTSMIIHESGEWMQSTVALPSGAVKGTSDIQHLGSMITYMRRYSLAAIAGIAQVDNEDDLTPDIGLEVKHEGIDLTKLESSGVEAASRGRDALEKWFRSQSITTKKYLSKDKKGKELMSKISSQVVS